VYYKYKKKSHVCFKEVKEQLVLSRIKFDIFYYLVPAIVYNNTNRLESTKNRKGERCKKFANFCAVQTALPIL